MLKYKIDVLAALKEQGYTSYRIRQEKLIGEAQMQKIRDKEIVSKETINKLCEMLSIQPGDLIEYIPYDIYRYSKNQVMVNHQELSDAIKGINHNEQFFSQSAKSALRNFLGEAKDSFHKDIPLGFYSYMSPNATTPEEQEYRPKLVVYKPEDLWIKLETYVHDKKTQDWLKIVFHDFFPECEIAIPENIDLE